MAQPPPPPQHPSLTCGFVADVLLSFVSPLLHRRGKLAAADLWPLRPDDEAAGLTDTLERAWEAQCAAEAARAASETARAASETARAASDAAHAASTTSAASTAQDVSGAPPPRLFAHAWASAFLPGFSHVGLFAFSKAMLALAQMRVVLLLLGVIGDPARSAWEGLAYAAAIGVLGAGSAISDALYWRATWFYGHRWQVAAIGLLFRKSLRLRVDSLRRVSTGHVVSLATNDAERFLQMVHHIPHLFLLPLDGSIYVYFLYHDLGSAAFAGVGVMLLAMGIQLVYYSSVFGRLRRARSLTTDARLDLTGQVLAGIRVIKLDASEPPFFARARALRATETQQLQAGYRVRGVFEGLIHSKYLLLTGVTLLTLWAQGIDITPGMVFSASTLFYLLEMDRAWRFVENVENLSDANVSFDRYTRFLRLPESQRSEADVAADVSCGGAVSCGGVANTPARSGPRERLFASGGSSALRRSSAEADTASTVSNGNLTIDARPLMPESPAYPTPAASPIDDTTGGVAGVDLCASWETGSGDAVAALAPVLHGVSLRVRPGELCAVVGPVGCGKSSLLLALLGELPLQRGSLRVDGSLSYAPQSSIIFSGSVRENVEFGAPRDDARLAAVLAACQFTGELSSEAMLGERGITLSGGQRARVGLARALFRRASVYLLDDPLSALDATVGRRIFDDAIRGPLLQGAAVVLVTHQLHFLRAASSILVLAGGRSVLQGAYSSLWQQHQELQGGAGASVGVSGGASGGACGGASGGASGGAAEAAVGTVGRTTALKEPSLPEQSGVAQLGGSLIELLRKWEAEEAEEDAAEAGGPTAAPDCAPATPVASAASTQAGAELSGAFGQSDAGEHGGTVAFVEDGGYGSVKREVFNAFVRFWVASGPVVNTLGIALILVVGAVAFPLLGWWLGEWCGMDYAQQQQVAPAAIYGVLLLVTLVLCVARPVCWAVRCVTAGRVLHDAVFHSVLKATVAFFDERPAGSVLARFSKDIQVLDERLPLTTCDVVLQAGRTLGVLALVCASNPWMLLAMPPLIYIFSSLRQHFVITSRTLKRLESAARPPVLSAFSETLAALPVVRAFGSSARLALTLSDRLDTHSRAWTAFFFATRWLALRLDFLCVALLTTSAAAAVLARDATSPGTAAASLSFITMLLGELDWAIRQSVEAENAMLSVERLMQYAHIPGEDIEVVPGGAACEELFTVPRIVDSALFAAAPIEVISVPPSLPALAPSTPWPSRGAVTFSDVSMRYKTAAAAHTFALRGVSFAVPAGTRVGIVGRTGAGKSSLIAALLRLSEPERHGSSGGGVAGGTGVTIDGVDTAAVPLSRLRAAISVVPQEPTLFGGTARSNLDPFSKHTDAACWAALEAVCLAPLFRGDARGLAAPIEESGGNLSVGQRQLLCLARSALRSSRVLAIDEATANVDADTDALIQRALRTAFGPAVTVLIIAHRLQTVLDCDCIVVLSQGRVVQCGPPSVLARDAGGPFAALLAEAEAAKASRK